MLIVFLNFKLSVLFLLLCKFDKILNDFQLNYSKSND